MNITQCLDFIDVLPLFYVSKNVKLMTTNSVGNNTYNLLKIIHRVLARVISNSNQLSYDNRQLDNVKKFTDRDVSYIQRFTGNNIRDYSILLKHLSYHYFTHVQKLIDLSGKLMSTSRRDPKGIKINRILFINLLSIELENIQHLLPQKPSLFLDTFHPLNTKGISKKMLITSTRIYFQSNMVKIDGALAFTTQQRQTSYRCLYTRCLEFNFKDLAKKALEKASDENLKRDFSARELAISHKYSQAITKAFEITDKVGKNGCVEFILNTWNRKEGREQILTITQMIA